MTWIKVTDRLPNKNGSYLVVKKYYYFRRIDVTSFAKNLHEVDEYDFPDEKRPGWYEYDDESGYYECSGITHWAELPELPEDEDAEIS